MTLTEFNEEVFVKGIREEGIEEGIEKGIEKGIEEGIEKGIEKGREEGIEEVFDVLHQLKEGSSEHELISMGFPVSIVSRAMSLL